MGFGYLLPIALHIIVSVTMLRLGPSLNLTLIVLASAWLASEPLGL